MHFQRDGRNFALTLHVYRLNRQVDSSRSDRAYHTPLAAFVDELLKSLANLLPVGQNGFCISGMSGSDADRRVNSSRSDAVDPTTFSLFPIRPFCRILQVSRKRTSRKMDGRFH